MLEGHLQLCTTIWPSLVDCSVSASGKPRALAPGTVPQAAALAGAAAAGAGRCSSRRSTVLPLIHAPSSHASNGTKPGYTRIG